MGIAIQDIASVTFSVPDLDAMVVFPPAAWRSANKRRISHEQPQYESIQS